MRSAISNPEWVRVDAVPFIRMIVERYREQSADHHNEITYASREQTASSWTPCLNT